MSALAFGFCVLAILYVYSRQIIKHKATVDGYKRQLEVYRKLTPEIVDYKTSKTDKNISTIRHGFNLLKRVKELEYIRKKVINEKAFSNLDNDFFADNFDDFLTSIDGNSVYLNQKILPIGETYRKEMKDFG